MKIMGQSTFDWAMAKKCRKISKFRLPGRATIHWTWDFLTIQTSKLTFHPGNVACRSNHYDFSPVLSWGFHQVGYSFAYRNSWWLGKRWNDMKWNELNEWMIKWLELNWMKLSSRYSPFAELTFQKCSERDSFLTIFMWNRAPPTVSCTFRRPNLWKVLWQWPRGSSSGRASRADCDRQPERFALGTAGDAGVICD